MTAVEPAPDRSLKEVIPAFPWLAERLKVLGEQVVHAGCILPIVDPLVVG